MYDNPIEGKLAFDRIPALDTCHPRASRACERSQASQTSRQTRMCTAQACTTIRCVVSLINLTLECSFALYRQKCGRLEMHLDYSIHPISGMERRVNLIVYLNSDRQQEWGGDLRLWEGDAHQPTKLAQRILPLFIRAVLFRTSDISWHGMPDELHCPSERGRKSLAIYFVSPPTVTDGRPKASFRPRPDGPTDENYLELCQRRSTRRLTPEDVSQHMPEWTPRW